MTYVVTERCVGCRYTECVAECPVACFFELDDPPMLIINPDECIDCHACVSMCPVNAIYPESEVPQEYLEWIHKNDAALCLEERRISQTGPALPGARSIDQIKEEETARFGHPVRDPSA